MPSSVRTPLSVVSLLLVLLAMPFLWRVAFAADTDGEGEPSTPTCPCPASVITCPLIRAGLDSESLAAVGVASDDIPSTLAEAVDVWVADPDRLPDADAAYASARRSVDSLRRLVRSGRGSEQDVADLASAKQDLEDAQDERQAALDAMRAAAAESMSSSKATLLECAYQNRRWDFAPVWLRVKDRSQADWVKLRDALTNEKVADRYGDDPDATLQSFLSSCRSDADAATCKVNYEGSLTAVEAAWITYVGD